LKYEDLKSGKDLTASIAEAFGYKGIGLLAVSGIPNYPDLRKKLLNLCYKFATLPKEIKDKYVHEESKYSYGWSHGKEILSPGKFDTFKGSYYNNPQYDVATTDEALQKAYPEVCSTNIWPKEELPDFEHAFKDLGNMLVDTGLLIAKQCDAYVKQVTPGFKSDNSLEQIIVDSRTCKARLLHYFPINDDATARTRESWCGWHNDHGSLTGLCPALYIRNAEGSVVPNPDPESGLYARTRDGKEFHVKLSGDLVAYQIGESAQINSGGALMATPHAVQAIRYPESKDLSREAFAVFMQPNFDKKLIVPKGKNLSDCQVLGDRFKKGMTFGDFGKATIEMYYSGKFTFRV